MSAARLASTAPRLFPTSLAIARSDRKPHPPSKLGPAITACAAALLCLMTSTASLAQTYKTLSSFTGTNGSGPQSSLIQGTDGNLYGTTSAGGLHSQGTVFRVTTKGRIVALHSFCSLAACADGELPLAGVIQGLDGYLYGTTSAGGGHTSSTDCSTGCGTVFKMTHSGTLTTLYSFCAKTSCTDGYSPVTNLVEGTDHNFYGTTEFGGPNGIATGGDGTVFKITSKGVMTTLYNFCSHSGCADGATPRGALIQGADGNFYGTTRNGGAFKDGTVFQLTPSGTLTTLYSFCSSTTCAEGYEPLAAVVQGLDGNLYGTSSVHPAVFEVTTAGVASSIYIFCSQEGCTDGSDSYAPLIQATDGNFYGTTVGGGLYDRGTIFQVTSSGTLTTLYNFCPSMTTCTDGNVAITALLQDTDGNFYGTTAAGGTSDNGVVFKLSMGFAPFVEPMPASGAVGAQIIILGTGLKGSTKVTFNGTPATFKVVGSYEIKATVPAGATTGSIQVTTLSGTVLTSNVPFQVP